MKILFAAPNRDLLQGYQRILREDFGETLVAFDGAQLLGQLAAGGYTLAVLDRALPRVRHELLLRQLEREGIPVITLLHEPLTVKHLTESPLSQAFLSYPFRAEELCGLIREVLAKRQSEECLPFANTALETAGFRLRGGAALTAAEMDVLRALLSRDTVCREDAGVLAAALNHKLQQGSVKAKIQYETGKGFVLVTEDEESKE